MNPWGPLKKRYESERPRKMLALDGGGIRGALSLEILAGIEKQLRKLTRAGEDFRLCDFFDYIGGTSTGAIIAAGLARGMSVAELLAFYEDAGPKMFEKSWLLKRLKSLYEAEPLTRQLQETFGENTDLFPKNLRCLLLVVTRNLTTDSPWPVSSNPLAKYNDPAREDCNLKIPLWQLVRASTAAPVYFPPEVVKISKTGPDKVFVFEDGGVTPYNNPAFLLFKMATLAEYRLGWKTGERNLMLVSVGTGAAPVLQSGRGDRWIPTEVASLPGALMYGAQVDQDVNCRVTGHCVHGDSIDRELGDLVPRDGAGRPASEDLGRAFLYARYNADLSAEGLAGLGLKNIDPAEVRKMDAVSQIPNLRKIGRRAARQVDMKRFQPFLNA